MQIVELGENSMVIMKDSEDAPWVSVGNIYRNAIKMARNIIVAVEDANSVSHYQESSEAVYTAGRLVLFFEDSIDPAFQLHTKVQVFC